MRKKGVDTNVQYMNLNFQLMYNSSWHVEMKSHDTLGAYFYIHQRAEKTGLYLFMQRFGLDQPRVYVKQAGSLWKTSWTYFVVQFLRLYWDPRVLHNGIDVHFVRDPGYQVLNMIVHRLHRLRESPP